MHHQDKNKIFSALSAAAAIALLYGFFFSIGITCPIKFLTGVSCPGCGLTRATLAFLRGDLKQAFYYHPLFILPFVTFFVYPFRRRLPAWTKKLFLVNIILIFMIIFFWRMFFVRQDIVVFDPESGFIFQAAGFFLRGIRSIL